MQLAHRVPMSEDFDAFYNSCFSFDRADDELRGVLRFEWELLLEAPERMSMLVLDTEGGTREVVGCAQAVFVSDAFTGFVKATDVPCVNRMVVCRLPDGEASLLNDDQIRAANHPGRGLNVLVTRWMRSNSLTAPDEKLRVQEYMNRAFQQFSRGYYFKEMLIPATGAGALRRGLAAGLLLGTDYAGYYRDNPPSPPPQTHPYLLGITREESFRNEGSRISDVFAHAPALFRFQPRHQEMLRRALSGDSDEEIAVSLRVSPQTVKNWWAVVFQQVMEKRPSLLPVPDDAAATKGRGKEKRGPLLQYLRDHFEELRSTPAP